MSIAGAPAETKPSTLLPKIRSALFEIASEDPAQAPRWMLRIICMLFLTLVVWSTFAHLDIVAVAQGRLVPQTYVKIVQPSDSGIVREILVKEGDQVREGQVLVRLDATENTADSTASERELAIQQLQIRRIDAELSGAPMTHLPADDALLFGQALSQGKAHRQEFLDSVAQEQAARDRTMKDLLAGEELLSKLEKTLPSYERSAKSYEALAAQKLVGALQAEEKRREALEKSQDLKSQSATVEGLEAAVKFSDRRLIQLKSAYESGLHAERVTAQERVTQLEQEGVKLKFRQGRLELRAPQAGTVKELSTTTIGAVVQPGTVLLSLVPLNEPLLAEVAVENQDIGFVQKGQSVRLKIATFPFQKYGMLEGTVRTLIADASQQSQGNEPAKRTPEGNGVPSFKAIVALEQQSLKLGATRLPLVAGMQLSAEIVEGERTVLEYLLSPIHRVVSEAGSER
jgi:HlyD family secretion protein